MPASPPRIRASGPVRTASRNDEIRASSSCRPNRARSIGSSHELPGHYGAPDLGRSPRSAVPLHNDRSIHGTPAPRALLRRRMKMDRMRTLGRRQIRWLALLGAAAMLLIAPLGSSTALAAGSTVGFGFHAPDVSGFPTGSVALTGGGAFNLDAAASTVHAGGGFSCTHDVGEGYMSVCLQCNGVRFDTACQLAGTMFKSTGAAGEFLKHC